jgi:hypothetical protein
MLRYTHTACLVINTVRQIITLLVVQRVFLGDRTINTGLWPPRSPDVNPCNRFLLVEHVTDRMDSNNPRYENDIKKKFKIWYFQFHQQKLDVQLTERFLRMTCDFKPKEALWNSFFK